METIHVCFVTEKKIMTQKFAGVNYRYYLCNTRTRQASQRCSNVRVVFLIPIIPNANIL